MQLAVNAALIEWSLTTQQVRGTESVCGQDVCLGDLLVTFSGTDTVQTCKEPHDFTQVTLPLCASSFCAFNKIGTVLVFPLRFAAKHPELRSLTCLEQNLALNPHYLNYLNVFRHAPRPFIHPATSVSSQWSLLFVIQVSFSLSLVWGFLLEGEPPLRRKSLLKIFYFFKFFLLLFWGDN